MKHLNQPLNLSKLHNINLNQVELDLVIDALDALAVSLHGVASQRHKSTVINELINKLERLSK